jgi:hypothetical protein
MYDCPEKFRNLHAGEEFVRARSIEVIAKSDDPRLHLEVSEKAADLIYHFIHRDAHRDDDDLAIRLLGIRIFNALNATLKLILAGYYQASTLQHRDMIETFFLLDYFLHDRSLVARWRTADDKIMRSTFAPVEVRKALDERDGFTGKKRAEAYKLFSTLAGHPHPRGSRMLQLPDGSHHCGPFFEETAMKATLAELGKSALQAAGIFSQFFQPVSKTDYQVKVAFLETQQRWLMRFFAKEPVPTSEIEAMRAVIARLPDTGAEAPG